MIVRGELSDWPEPGPAARLELFLPDTPSGPVIRIYTVRDWNRERQELMIDMTLNDGHGPATQWASRVVPGMRLEISGASRSTFTPAPSGGSYLFAGDESAVPAITTSLASLPQTANAVAVLEVESEAERQHVISRAQTRVRWLYRSPSHPKQSLIEAVVDEVAARNPSSIWLAGEADMVRAIRSHLLAHEHPVEHISAWVYWKQGVSNHADSIRQES
jgi:NADPH-dependent ferric siderophore reductase